MNINKTTVLNILILVLIAIVSYLFDYSKYIILVAILTMLLLKYKKTQKLGLLLLFVEGTFLFSYWMHIPYIQVIVAILIILTINKLIQDSLLKQQQVDLVKEKLNVAKRNVVDTSEYAIVVTDEDFSIL